jgi:hypothetical protein
MEAMDAPEQDGSPRWRRLAATMADVNLTYRRLPGPIRALIWLVPAFVAHGLGLPLWRWW